MTMMNVLDEMRRVGRAYPAKAPPIPVVLSGMGMVGHVENRRGLYLNSALKRHVEMLVRDNYRAEIAAREMTNGLFGADDILPIAARGTDSRDAIKTIKSMRSALSSWDAVTASRGGTKFWDMFGTKASLTTVASQWHSFLLAAGVPGTASYAAIPGPAAFSSATAGAWPLGGVTLGGSDDLYLTNMGTNHQTGTNVVLAVDVLTANGSISGTIVTSQNVSSTALPRWTGGAGVMMTLEVTTAMGAATGIPNVTVNYTDQGGATGNSTGAISIGLTSAGIGRLLPVQDGPFIRLATGDYGVASVQQVTFSASSAGAGAAVALLQYKPLVMLPTLANTTFVERATGVQLGGIRKLTSVPGGSMPFIGFLVLPSTTSTGIQLYLLETVYG